MHLSYFLRVINVYWIFGHDLSQFLLSQQLFYTSIFALQAPTAGEIENTTISFHTATQDGGKL